MRDCRGHTLPGRGGGPTQPIGAFLLDHQLIVDPNHAVYALGDLRSEILGGSALHGTGQRDHALLGVDVDVQALEGVVA